jgi:hypothetical protein
MFTRAYCCRENTVGEGALTSIMYDFKQRVSGQICGEALRMPWDLDALMGCG